MNERQKRDSMTDDDKPESKGQQLNIRVRRGVVALWEEAASTAGMTLSSWLKKVASAAAIAEIAAVDEKYGSRKP
jgi:uncharacterized protein (DUF1778 family)